MNEWISDSPFELYGLHVFLLVAETGSFTKAAKRAGLTQSAVTRQIGSLEANLGMRLFERTTRQVRLTPAGEMLRAEARAMLNSADVLVARLRESFARAAPVLRVGVSRAIGLAYLPGFFHAFQKSRPEVRITVASAWGARIRERLLEGELDVGLLCLPRRLEPGLRVTHRFEDAFVVIAPPDRKNSADAMSEGPWLGLGGNGSTAMLVREWLDARKLAPSPAMLLDGFDLIINLVSQGMGVSVVPRRALALYRRNRPVTVLEVEGERLERELAVVVRKDRRPPAQVTDFVESVLF